MSYDTTDRANELHCCDEMRLHLSQGKIALNYSQRFREYHIMDRDEGPAGQRLTFCPWCGRKLPESLRKQWFESIWALGLEPDDEGIPVEYMSDAWWNLPIR
jgi:hypothetical protein